MGAAEALWQRRGASRCFAVHRDSKMTPKLAYHHHQRSSSENTEKDSFYESKWWLKGSSGFDEDNTKLKKLHDFVDLREQEGVDYCFISKKDTTTPWWRSTNDKDDLALLVATKSVNHIQNCCLPPPQKLHKSIHCTSGDKGFKTAAKSYWKQGARSDRFERSLSSSGSTESKDTILNSSPMSDDLSKAQLLGALRLSQTRAREAEKAAREACVEKELVMTIFLRQASQLLAYKQWVKLLEMGAIYRQMNKGEEEEPEIIKGVNLKKRKQRGKTGLRYMMAFALGFSLIGAGLLLGWAVGVGWLYPF